eukprot:CAMPEP_0184011244 /NCGR_PEP_ID=MMETSP0954-20121128/3711_1 /TAXON_ID=627963 /ORGANISM="Aplanochytrium sp, Strain PBS07" /LENGTH=152 /DNA_ID=CAMNT_0026291023 /DNA_START=329 /DNA_END=784 /DNA_ORIENTATION=+
MFSDLVKSRIEDIVSGANCPTEEAEYWYECISNQTYDFQGRVHVASTLATLKLQDFQHFVNEFVSLESNSPKVVVGIVAEKHSNTFMQNTLSVPPAGQAYGGKQVLRFIKDFLPEEEEGFKEDIRDIRFVDRDIKIVNEYASFQREFQDSLY